MALSLLTKPFSSKPIDPESIRTVLTVDELVNMTPVEVTGSTYKDHADVAGQNLLKCHLKNQFKVRGLFFPDNGSNIKEAEVDHTLLDYQKFSVAYVCQAIRRTRYHGFSDSVDIGRVDNYLNLVYTSLGWTSTGYDLYSLTFPDIVRGKNNNSFRQYMDSSRREWAKKLSDTITTEPWLGDHVRRLATNQWPHHNVHVNVLLYMVDQLDCYLTDLTFSKLRKGIPDITMDFKNRRWANLDPGDIFTDIKRTTDDMKMYHIKTPKDDSPSAAMYHTHTVTVYGERVEDWLKATAKSYQFYIPGKLQNETMKGQGGCTLL